MDPLGPTHPSPDKVAHFFAMGILAILLERSRLLPRSWMAFVCVLIWAWIDEWTQGLVSAQRDASWPDIVCGWFGVVAAGVTSLALRPPMTTSSESPWQRMEATLDGMVGRGGGGVFAAAVASVTCVVAFPLWFSFFWKVFGWSQASVCLLLALMTGLVVAAPFIRKSWQQASGPRWPLPPYLAWLLIPAGLMCGWWCHQTLKAMGLPSFGWSLMMLGAIDGMAIAIRLGWLRAERAGAA